MFSGAVRARQEPGQIQINRCVVTVYNCTTNKLVFAPPPQKHANNQPHSTTRCLGKGFMVHDNIV